MANVVEPPLRSRMMAGIRCANTGPEMQLRRLLHASGYRCRLHPRHLPGKPDLAFMGRRIALFVHGCFWHRHERCHWSSTPASNTEFWDAKFTGNIERDRRQLLALQAIGWRVGIVWECSLRGHGAAGVVRALEDWFASDGPLFETPLVRERNL